MTIIVLSGGFDPIHPGHISMFEDAVHYGLVFTLLNSDTWLVRKKGFCLFPFDDRKYMLSRIKYISEVYEVDDQDGTVVPGIDAIYTLYGNESPIIFGNGGDRSIINTPEVSYCDNHNIKTVFGLGDFKYMHYHGNSILRKACEHFKV